MNTETLSKNTQPMFRFGKLWFFYSLFILYGTLIPFSFCNIDSCLNENLTKISWIPLIDRGGTRVSITDVVQNVIFYLPFGLLGYLTLKQTKLLSFMYVTLIGATLSIFGESLQLLTHDRVSSVTDVVTNSIGTLMGATSTAIAAKMLSNIFNKEQYKIYTDDYVFRLIIVAFCLVVVGLTEPFDFSLDVGIIWRKSVTIINNPLHFSLPLKDEFVAGLRFYIFSALLTFWFRKSQYSSPILKGVLYACLCGVTLEFLQIIIQSRMPNAQDILVVIIASLMGGIFIMNRPYFTIQHPFNRILAVAIVMLTWFSAGVQGLSPFELNNQYQKFKWIPFSTYYDQTNFVALSNFIESMLIYFPMGFILQGLSRRDNRLFSIGFVTLIMAASIELPQGWILGRYPTITDILGAVMGAISGAWVYVNVKKSSLLTDPTDRLQQSL